MFSPQLEAFAPIFPQIRFAKAIDQRTLLYLERLARRMEPALRDAFLAAVRSAKSQATLSVIEQAMSNIDPAMAIREASGGLEFRMMRETLADIVQAAGSRVTESLRQVTGATLMARFDLSNPYAAQYARTEVGTMVQEITLSTQEGIQNLVERGITEGITPMQTAREIKSMIGLTGQQTDWVVNYQNNLYSSGAVDIDVKVDRYANKLLRQRAQTISRTE